MYDHTHDGHHEQEDHHTHDGHHDHHHHGHEDHHHHDGHHHHVHSQEEKKAVMNRLAKAAGHLEKVRRMVDNDVDCSEVLIQIAAVRNAINNTGKLILKNHLEHCIVDAIRNNNPEEIEAFNYAIDKFIK